LKDFQFHDRVSASIRDVSRILHAGQKSLPEFPAIERGFLSFIFLLHPGPSRTERKIKMFQTTFPAADLDECELILFLWPPYLQSRKKKENHRDTVVSRK
jgi:hypothetical protein